MVVIDGLHGRRGHLCFSLWRGDFFKWCLATAMNMINIPVGDRLLDTMGKKKDPERFQISIVLRVYIASGEHPITSLCHKYFPSQTSLLFLC